MIVVGAAFRDEVEDAASCSAKLGTKQSCLNRDFGDRVLVVDYIGRTGDGNVVVLGSVNQVVVSARALAIHGKLR